MDTTNPAARDSRCETRTPTESPFRRKSSETRANAAALMLLKRGQELKVLQQALDASDCAAHRNALRTRIAATKRNMQSWAAYLGEDAPREARAVMHHLSA
jgi:hypothetical protein